MNLFVLLLLCVRVAAQAQGFEQTIRTFQETTVFEGRDAVLIVGNAEETLLTNQRGSSTVDTIFESASAIKWVTSVVFLRLVNDSKMSLDDTPGMYLNYWNDDKFGSRTTLRMLLSFTSGLRGFPALVPCAYDSTSSIEECAQNVYNSRFVYEPGTTYFYGPSHMVVAAAMAQQATGMSWPQIFQMYVKDVVGMPSTMYGDIPSVAGGGGTTTNGRDLEAFLKAMLTKPESFLPASLWDEMLTDQTSSVNFEFVPAFGYPFHYGLGVWRECHEATFDTTCQAIKVVSTTGGFGVHGWVDYENQMYGIIMTQSDRLDQFGAATLKFAIEELRPSIEADMSNAPLPTSSPTSTSPSPSRFCFSGDNVVRVKDKGTIAIRDLAVGDFVETRNGFFEQVYNFSHRDDSIMVDYLRLFFGSHNESIELTRDRLVFVEREIGGDVYAVPASLVKTGDVLLLSQGQGTTDTRVTVIEHVSRLGYYAPLTASGVISINGVLASNYVSMQEDSHMLIVAGISLSYPIIGQRTPS